MITNGETDAPKTPTYKDTSPLALFLKILFSSVTKTPKGSQVETVAMQNEALEQMLKATKKTKNLV